MVLYLVYKLLWVLHTNAHGERLCLEGPTTLSEETVDITGGMTGGENNRNTLILRTIGSNDADYPTLFYNKIRHTRTKMVLPTGGLNGTAHIGDNTAQTISADMSMHINHYIGVSTMVNKALKHIGNIAALGGTGVEFAVTESACAALTEAPIAVWIDQSGTGQRSNVAATLLDRLAALDDYGPHTQFNGTNGSE